MLDPKYLERFSDQLLGIIDTLTIAIISDMAKRIVKIGNMSESTKHQAEVLQNAGLVYKDTIKRVSQVSGYQKHEVQRMYEEAGVRNLKNEAVYYKQAGKEDIKLNQSNGMQRILQANIRKTCQELDNLTMTTAVRSQSAYIQACNRAQMKVSSGAFSYDKAIADAIKEAAVQGTEVLYPSQHVDKLDVAVRRAVLTGVNQTAAEMNLQYAKDQNCDYVETTAHEGARPEHAVWQGKVFCLSGTDPKYENFYEATGYGTGPGLCGWNCRHNFHAFFPGISTPAYTQEMLDDYSAKNVEYNGKQFTEYEAANRVNSAIYSGKQQRIDQEKGFMDLLDSALSKGTAEHKMVVHRDTIPEYLNAFPKGFQYSEEDIKRMNGMTLTNKGYTSTSFHDIMYQGRNVHLEIEIPKGYKGCLYIKDVATEKYKNQEEVLFKRGFQYKIKSVNKEKDRYYIKAEAVL